MLISLWRSQVTRHKELVEMIQYRYFALALKAAANKLDEYYEKTTDSLAYVMAMCLLPTQIVLTTHYAVLNPSRIF